MDEKRNGGVVAAFAMTHTPGLGNLMHLPPRDQIERIEAGFGVIRQRLEEAKPDVVVAFVNDHFDMYTTQGMPGFAIALNDTHWGPTPETENWIEMKRAPIPGNADLAHDIYGSLMEDGFELFRSDSAELVHNVLLAKKFIWPDYDIPVVPIFTNCFITPLPTFRRAHALGRAVRAVLDRRPERVALIATGGISHWPPIVFDHDDPNDPFVERVRAFNKHGRAIWDKDPTLAGAILEREREMAQSGRELINIEWDKEILDQLARADVSTLTALDHESVREIAGPGGSEMLMWVSLMGAMKDREADIVLYEAVKEWMGGVGLLSYARSIDN
ncbi:hypothetical protein [Novosphingobium naphthalenivorans]|uniref:DODA-type extradiol aromatic ring-opening family dioxygenase n=1 Tax=Novosphingobium naphthalenivorans TaxID=273168 RepID=UPI000AB1A208|nr:hypothetical protein [Novosphingobium naphthalenivorans]